MKGKEESKRTSLTVTADGSIAMNLDKIKLSNDFVVSDSLYDSPVFKYMTTTTRGDFIREII